jgi:hypothetical protein
MNFSGGATANPKYVPMTQNSAPVMTTPKGKRMEAGGVSVVLSTGVSFHPAPY